MLIISFAWTTAAFVAARKNVTRREWTDEYAKRFRTGTVFACSDRQIRHGGKILGFGRIAMDAYRETDYIPSEDYEGEGFGFMDAHGYKLPHQGDVQTLRAHWDMYVVNNRIAWNDKPKMYVVRFEPILMATEPRTYDEAKRYYELNKDKLKDMPSLYNYALYGSAIEAIQRTEEQQGTKLFI